MVKTRRKIAKIKSFQCNSCALSFSKENELEYHIKLNHHENIRLKSVCHNCKLVCDGKEKFRHHVESVHETDGGYKCTQCGDMFKSDKESSWWNWLKHSKYCNNRENKKALDNMYRKKVNTINTSSEKLFNCDCCDKSFTTKKAYASHKTYERKKVNLIHGLDAKGLDSSRERAKLHRHPPEDGPDEDIKDEEFKCDKCSEVFDTKIKLYYHNDRTHADKVTCEICGLVTNKYNMVMHRKRIHHLYKIPESKLVKKCDTCDTEFRSGAEMDSHLRECHDCDKQFQCRDCDLIWVSQLSLKLHYVEMHQKIMFC